MPYPFDPSTRVGRRRTFDFSVGTACLIGIVRYFWTQGTEDARRVAVALGLTGSFALGWFLVRWCKK